MNNDATKAGELLTPYIPEGKYKATLAYIEGTKPTSKYKAIIVSFDCDIQGQTDPYRINMWLSGNPYSYWDFLKIAALIQNPQMIQFSYDAFCQTVMSGTLQPVSPATRCEVKVSVEEYNGKTKNRIKWFSPLVGETKELPSELVKTQVLEPINKDEITF